MIRSIHPARRACHRLSRVPPDITRALPSTQCMYVEAARTPTCSVPPIGALASMGALTSRSQVCTSLRLTHNRPRMRVYALALHTSPPTDTHKRAMQTFSV